MNNKLCVARFFKDMSILSLLTFGVSIFVLAAPPPDYSQEWEVSGDTAEWMGNTTITNIEVVDTGGNPGGFLSTSGVGASSFDVGATNKTPSITGDFSSTEWIFSVDLKFISGNFDNAWLRIRYANFSENGWLFPLTNTFPVNEWNNYSVTFNPTWTDAEATATGWVTDSVISTTALPSQPWSTTLSDVYTLEVRISGEGPLEAGIDNARLAVQQCPASGTCGDGICSPEEASCSCSLDCGGVDTDNDGLSDVWETMGVDTNCDGIIDIDLPGMGANPLVPDTFLEIDYMNSAPTTPNIAAINQVISSFAAAGVTLHVDIGNLAPTTSLDLGEGGDIIPRADILDFSDRRPGGAASGLTYQDFYAAKSSFFNPTRRGIFHYAIYGEAVRMRSGDLAGAASPGDITLTVNDGLFGACPSGAAEVNGERFTYTGLSRSSGGSVTTLNGIPPSGSDGITASHIAGSLVTARISTSGTSEINGNDFMITMGCWGSGSGPLEDMEAGTLMHELGHNLGFWHSGGSGSGPNFEPNFQSVMNYRYQTSGLRPIGSTSATRVVDYSHEQMPELDEDDLDETAGMGSTENLYDGTYDCPDNTDRFTAPTGIVDWNCNGANETSVNVNISGASGTVLTGWDDWSNINYSFQCEAAFSDGASIEVVDEIDEETLAKEGFLYPLLEVEIDVLPKCEFNPIQVDGRGTVDVAIIATNNYDVSKIDLESLLFAGAPYRKHKYRDINGDKVKDLLVIFDASKMRFEKLTTKAFLSGQMSSSQRITGSDSVMLVDSKNTALRSCSNCPKVPLADGNNDGVCDSLQSCTYHPGSKRYLNDSDGFSKQCNYQTDDKD